MEELLAQARTLERTHAAEAAKLYAQVLQADRGCLEAHNALERLGAPESFGAWMHINGAIDPRDDIFRFFAQHPTVTNPVRDYLSDGWRTLSELLVFMDELNQPLTRTGSMLEFASGFGRFTRHLVRVLPGRVTCSDIIPGASEFTHAQFGAHILASSADPAQICLQRRFDLVFVLSMFTHLPTHMWAPWLRTLFGLVNPGGALVFTIHNESAALREGIRFDASGEVFIPSSESPSLPGHQYGTTFTTRAAAVQRVQEALGMGPVLHREKAFWSGQDAMALTKAGP